MQVEGTGISARFELKTDEIWPVPEPGMKTQVYLALEMTNSSKNAVRFPVMDKFSIAFKDEQGRELSWEGGQDGIIPGKPLSDPISSGETFVLNLKSHMGWGPSQQLQVSIEDGLGSIWWIGPLEKGGYRVKMKYENRSADSPDVWYGRASIKPVSIQIK